MINDKTLRLDLSSKNQEEIKVYLEAILAVKYKFSKTGMKLTVKKTGKKANQKNVSLA